MTQSKIVANMVVRNEAQNYLRPVLERLVNQVDLICVTDDASDDETPDVALEFGAKLMRMPEPTFTTHEGRLRQASWNHLEQRITQDEPWWVLAIDADEMLFETRYKMRDIIESDQFDVLGIEFFHMWNETQFRVDKAWRPHGSSRLFRYKSDGFFQNRALACGSEPTYVMDAIRQGKFWSSTGLLMKHLSYIKDADKQAKYDRYAKIDGGAFHANAHIESILDTDPVLVDWPYE